MDRRRDRTGRRRYVLRRRDRPTGTRRPPSRWEPRSTVERARRQRSVSHRGCVRRSLHRSSRHFVRRRWRRRSASCWRRRRRNKAGQSRAQTVAWGRRNRTRRCRDLRPPPCKRRRTCHCRTPRWRGTVGRPGPDCSRRCAGPRCSSRPRRPKSPRTIRPPPAALGLCNRRRCRRRPTFRRRIHQSPCG